MRWVFQRLVSLLSKYKDSLAVNLWIPAGLAAAIFTCRTLPVKVALPIGGFLTLWLTVHTYALKVIKDQDSNELDYWKRKSTSYTWLLVCIEKLISGKKQALETGVADRVLFGNASIERCLQMLLEFYVKNYGDPSLNFKVVYFVPSTDHEYLISKHWCNRGEQAPYSHGDIDKQKVIFRLSDSQTLAVRAWTTRATQVAENQSEIHYNYSTQRQTISSLIAFPVTGDRSADLIGIITVGANVEGFFRRADASTHELYIKQFGIRIALESYRMKASGPSQKEGA